MNRLPFFKKKTAEGKYFSGVFDFIGPFFNKHNLELLDLCRSFSFLEGTRKIRANDPEGNAAKQYAV